MGDPLLHTQLRDTWRKISNENRSTKAAHHLPYTEIVLAVRAMLICAPRQAWGPHTWTAIPFCQIGPCFRRPSGSLCLRSGTPVSAEMAPLPLIRSDDPAAFPQNQVFLSRRTDHNKLIVDVRLCGAGFRPDGTSREEKHPNCPLPIDPTDFEGTPDRFVKHVCPVNTLPAVASTMRGGDGAGLL